MQYLQKEGGWIQSNKKLITIKEKEADFIWHTIALSLEMGNHAN